MAKLLLSLLLFFLLTGCGSNRDDPPVFKSYLDVPGITREEINAIADLRARYDHFVFGMLPSTEAFLDSEGVMRGFSSHFCKWLSDFFDIPFVVTHFDWIELMDGLKDGSIQFTGELTTTEERRNEFFMTSTISPRTLMYYRLKYSEPLYQIRQTRLPRYLLIKNSVISDFVRRYAYNRFEPVFIYSYDQVYYHLRGGYADALVSENVLRVIWDIDSPIVSVDFMPMVYTSVTFTARHQKYEPIIAVVQRALEYGLSDHINELNDLGHTDYLRHQLLLSLTPYEYAILLYNVPVRIGARFNDYPTSFYNSRTGRWEGISFDILEEISDITSLYFEVVNEPGLHLNELLKMLENGEIEMLHTMMSYDMEDRFIWPQTEFLTENLVLISLQEQPNINLNRVYGKRVGVTADTPHMHIFNTWFPNHTLVYVFENRDEKFYALQRGDIDLAFNNHNAVLYYTNYREIMDFKVNVMFGEEFISTFAFYNWHVNLSSVIDKTLRLIDTDTIVVQWRYRTFDYRMRLVRAVIPWVVVAGLLLMCMCALGVILFLKTRNTSKKLAYLVDERTATLSTFFNAIPDVIFVKDKNLRYTNMNDAFANVFGCEKEALRGKTDEESGLPPELVKRLAEADTALMEKGELTTTEERVPHANGTIPYYETIRAPLTLDGKKIGLIGIARDITKHRLLEQSLEKGYNTAKILGESLAKITNSPLLFDENVMDAIAFIAQESAVALGVHHVTVWQISEDQSEMDNLYFYDAALKRSGYLDKFSFENCPNYLQALKNERLVVINNTREDNEIKNCYNQDICALLEAPIRIEGKIYGLISFEQEFSDGTKSREWTLEEKNYASSLGDIMSLVITDNDRHRAYETAETANQAKTDFLANMSHEIRTPMNSIIGFSELALDDEISPKTRDYLGKIKENSDWLMQTINDILDISKIESGRMELERVPFDIQKLFISCRTAIMPKALEKNLTLHFYAEHSEKIPLGDPVKLRQVLMNLLANAVKFTNAGIINLSAETKNETDNTITIKFEVKDSGIGMTQKQQAIVFEPFRQADTGTTRKYGGTGLGLSITKNMVELMGGELLVQSTPGLGSKFSFRLTFDTITAKTDTDKMFISHDMKKPTFKGEVLVCEDNSMNQQVLKEHLSRVGIDAVIAENGKAGVETIQSRLREGKRMFDLIFMDIHMPVMDGLEAVEKILELNIRTPIVALTANVMEHDKKLYKERGMDGYLGKPFSGQELWMCLLKYFELKAWQENDTKKDKELQEKLMNNFVKSNTNKIDEITTALETGDIKLAHRLTHSLKGNAGQLNKVLLQKAAYTVEEALKGGENTTTPEQIQTLAIELSMVLAELIPAISENAMLQEFLSPKDALGVLQQLEPILKDSDPECLNLIPELRMIKGSDDLIKNMEDFNFKQAEQIFDDLIREMEANANE
ncbi:MAG: ATP-binding protein [Defluviitaleaceae bacterium]|nr:ATP-binding protein [Defluviitaleaceae bacterium]